MSGLETRKASKGKGKGSKCVLCYFFLSSCVEGRWRTRRRRTSGSENDDDEELPERYATPPPTRTLPEMAA